VSRIGRLPVAVPPGVQVSIQGTEVSVKGPKGELKRAFSPLIELSLENGQVFVKRNSDLPTERALHGTTRALIQNMVSGVSNGFTKVLEIDGVGYRAEMEGTDLVLYLGFSHPVKVKPKSGITFDVDIKARQIKVTGFNKEVVGQVTADLRKIRPPEPYKGKGIHYLGERIRRKPGKSAKTKAA
jgi:large subunit ribosomal protein L6